MAITICSGGTLESAQHNEQCPPTATESLDYYKLAAATEAATALAQ